MNGNVTVVQIVPQEIEYLPSACIWKLYIQSDRNWCIAVDEIEDFNVTDCNDGFQSFTMRFFYQYFSEPQVIFHNQHNFFIRLYVAPVVARIIDHLIYDAHVRLNTLVGNAN